MAKDEVGTRLSATIQLVFVVDLPPDGVTGWMEKLKSDGVLVALLSAAHDTGLAIAALEDLDDVEIQQMFEQVHVTSATCLVCSVGSGEYEATRKIVNTPQPWRLPSR